MTRPKTWYLVWPKRIEPIEWDDYLARHEKDPGQFWDARGPFPTQKDAEEFLWVDMVPKYWEAGLTVWATHCLECGRWAKMLAGDHVGGGWGWEVTDCKKCGIKDSRV